MNQAGEEHWFARTGSGRMAVGSHYTAQVTRRDGGAINLHGTPEYAGPSSRPGGPAPPCGPRTPWPRPGSRPCAPSRTPPAATPWTRRSPRSWDLAAPLRTGAQRDALAAYVIRKLHSTGTTRKPPGGRQ